MSAPIQPRKESERLLALARELLNQSSRLVEPVQEQKKLDISHPPGKLDERVFIGGNYALMPILRIIKEIVLRQNLQPILAYDFDIPRERTNEYSLRLLHNCRRAIFEATVADGHLMEIQEVVNSQWLGITTLVLYMSVDSAKDVPDTATSMIKTLAKPRPQGYVTLQELDVIATNFLRTPIK